MTVLEYLYIYAYGSSMRLSIKINCVRVATAHSPLLRTVTIAIKSKIHSIKVLYIAKKGLVDKVYAYEWEFHVAMTKQQI